jgi:hypothetical protein
MGFIKLDYCLDYGESVSARTRTFSLQKHFNEWRAGAELRGGVPNWLKGVTVHGATGNKYLDQWGFSFYADALGCDSERNYVFELKYAPKYEPIAIAESIHHAAELPRPLSLNGRPFGKPDASITPVIISQWNAWNRSTLMYLRRAGIKPEQLRYIEVVALTAAQPATEPFLWFEEPMVNDLLEKPPSELPLDLSALAKGNRVYWYQRTGSDTWVASRDKAEGELSPSAKRMVFVPLGDGKSGKWLAWCGTDMVGGNIGYSLFDPNKAGQPPEWEL